MAMRFVLQQRPHRLAFFANNTVMISKDVQHCTLRIILALFLHTLQYFVLLVIFLLTFFL